MNLARRRLPLQTDQKERLKPYHGKGELPANSGENPSVVTSPQTTREVVMTIFELGALGEFVGAIAVVGLRESADEGRVSLLPHTDQMTA